MKLNFDYHQPALLKQVTDYLDIRPGEVYVDATIGGGGHSLEILKKGGRIIGLDWDSEAVDFSRKRLAHFCHTSKGGNVCPLDAFKIYHANFISLGEICNKLNIHPAGILYDLGTSFHQLKSKGRGFSFQIDEPLDMRMDKNLKVTASDLIAGLSQKELYELFNNLGEEKYSRAIAHDIVFTRQRDPIKTTYKLAQIAQNVYIKFKVKSKIHPATKIFQALRIAVNDELNNLKIALPESLDVLKKNGKLIIISFHGLEDKIVKHFFRKKMIDRKIKILTKKPIRPTFEQIKENPNCRSARMRVAQKV